MLSEAVIKEIRVHGRRSGTKNIAKLAEKFQVSKNAVRSIIENETHKNPNYIPPKKRKENIPFDILFARQMLDRGFTFQQIAELDGEFSKRPAYSRSRVRELLTEDKEQRENERE